DDEALALHREPVRVLADGEGRLLLDLLELENDLFELHPSQCRDTGRPEHSKFSVHCTAGFASDVPSCVAQFAIACSDAATRGGDAASSPAARMNRSARQQP